MTAIPHKFEGYQNVDPPENGFDIVPDDENELDDVTRMLRVNGNAGVVVVEMAKSGTMTMTLNSGEWLPIAVKKVLETGTTATGLQGFF